MVRNKVLVFVIILFGLMGCKDNFIHIYSPDGSQVISVLNDGHYRYVFDGKVNNLSSRRLQKVAFAKLDIRGVFEIGDALFVCWKNDSYEWELLCPKSKIVQNELESSRFNILTEHVLDDRGVPKVLKYHKDGCFEYGIESGNVYPKGNATIQ